MKVLVVIGTRPEAIKMAPVILALRRSLIETCVCASGQHREMLIQALDAFSIKPDVALDVMRPGQSLNQLAAKILNKLEPILIEKSPDWVLVQGDTTTAFSAGYAAFHKGVKVGHIEAGLRTNNLASPFPEEANRLMLSKIATAHFAPTHLAQDALLNEAVPPNDIHVTGNTIIDAIDIIRNMASFTKLNCKLSELLTRAGSSQIVLITCHRRENFGDTLEAICLLVKRLAQDYHSHHWVFPVHLNPNIQEPVRRILAGIPNISLIEPVDYLSSLQLISRAALIVTDSGGIQEEAPSFGVPVVIMRNHTERREGVEAGFAVLASQSVDRIESSIRSFLDGKEQRSFLKNRPNPYGDGRASERIVSILVGKKIEAFRG